MTRIALTGASGNVGRGLLDGFDDADLRPFTHSEHDDIDSDLLDVTDPEDVQAALADVDVVVHLAGASSPDADWPTALETNVEGTRHVLDAAVEHGVDRVVFASSNHAVGGYYGGDDPEALPADYTDIVDADAAPFPDSFYGASKAACEALAARYAHCEGLSVVSLRIGWYMSEADLRETVADSGAARARFARALWLSPRDCRDVHEKAATADLPRSPITVNAVSRNDDRIHSITETMRLLGYTPRDDAAEVLAE